MPAAPSEPEKYSIDEMMDRLKNPSSGNPEQDGERVVRADGTEAIRVRKRKRRSTQPHKELAKRTRRSRILQVSGAIVLAAIAGLGIGTAVIYANSPPFREGLLEKIAQSTGAKPEIKMFRMNPQSANAASLSLTWPEGNVLGQLDLQTLVAEVSPASFLGKAMSGEEVTVSAGSLALRVPAPGEPLRFQSAAEGAMPLQFNRYRVPNFNLSLGEPAAPMFQLLGSEASLSLNKRNGRTQFSLNRGDLILPGWPKLRMDRSFMEFRGTEVDVVSLRLLDEIDPRGIFEFTGTISPYSPDKQSTLSVEMETFPLSGIIGPALGTVFSGKIDSIPTTKSNYFSFYPSANPAPKFALSFQCSHNSQMEISGFPFLSTLSQTLDDEWFKRPAFLGENATGSLIRQEGVLGLRDLNFESKGRMAIRGQVSVTANQDLTGNLDLGIAENMFAASPKALRLQALFGPPRDGFVWLALKIGGTAASPKDDFNDLLQSSSAARAPERPEPRRPSGSTFEELTTPE